MATQVPSSTALDRSTAITVFIVAYHPDPQELWKLFDRLLESKKSIPNISVSVIHNDTQSLLDSEIKKIYTAASGRGLTTHTYQANENLGFGGGVNELARHCSSLLFLILNQDAIPEPGAIEHLVGEAVASAQNVAAWEMRQIPYEHPKIYHPATMETPWASAAALLVRSTAFHAVGGFEAKIFMYGEDVDLSWKMRAQGWKIHYVAKAAVVHETYEDPTKSKPLQVIGAVYAGLALRARYSGRKQIMQALSMAVAEICLPRQEFPNRRKAIAGAALRFAMDYHYYRRTAPAITNPDFEPYFAGWSYEERRIGAFHRFHSSQELGSDLPLVSILIRTCGRPGMLREAIQSAANQTWPNIEIVVVEDGPGEAEAICREFAPIIPIRFHQHDPRVGRSQAGNTALALAAGEWVCFLDDDDLLFADHCEVLVQTSRENNLKGAYGLAWRVFTDVRDGATANYREIGRDVFPHESFNRLAMWEHNLFPIQAAVFHRELYDCYGGFDTKMDQLEDWNLWTRYTVNHDFLLVEKVTSCYRVPSQADQNLSRQRNLDLAYASAREKQEKLPITMTVGELKSMLDSVASQPPPAKTVSKLRRFVRNRQPLLAIYRRIQALVHRH